MARKKSPAKTPAMEDPALYLRNLRKHRWNPDELRELEARNRELISIANESARLIIRTRADIFKGKTFERGLYILKNGDTYHVSKDAPPAVQSASKYLLTLSELDAATNDGDVKLVRELAIEVGVSAVEVAVEASRRKSLLDLMRKHDVSLSGSIIGGSDEPVWKNAKVFAVPSFAKFKSGKGVSDTAALKRTRAELIKLQKEGKFDGKVPGLTCLREHLVKKPPSGK